MAPLSFRGFIGFKGAAYTSIGYLRFLEILLVDLSFSGGWLLDFKGAFVTLRGVS